MTRSHLLAFVAFVSGLGFSAGASAQALHLSVSGSADARALGVAIADDLGRPVDQESEGEPHLEVELTDGVATLVFRSADGTRRQRVIEVTGEREEVLRVLTMMATNLVRDQSDGLIAAVAPRREPPPGAPAASPAEALAEPEAEGPEPRELDLGRAIDSGTLSFASRRPLSIGASGFAGLHSGVAGQVSPYGTYGLSVMGVLHPMVSIGVTRLSIGLGLSSLEGLLFSAGGTPVVELFGFVDPHVQLYGQLGVAIQGRTQTQFLEGLVQVAPSLAAGVRFWATDWFTIGLELGASVVATDGFLISGVSLPQGSVPGTLGLNVEFHIAP